MYVYYNNTTLFDVAYCSNIFKKKLKELYGTPSYFLQSKVKYFLRTLERRKEYH